MTIRATKAPVVIALLFALFLVSKIETQAADFMITARQNVVCFGDSITANGEYAQIMQDFIDEKYPERRITVMARGASGHTVQDSIKRLEIDVTRWKPDWVIIHLGINDDVKGFSPEDYLRLYEFMINRILRDTGARLAVVSPICPENDGNHDRLAQYALGLQALARKYDLVYVPLFEETKRLGPSMPGTIRYSVDGIHPDHIGYMIMAQTILHALDFPLSKQPLALDVPARRTVVDQSDALAGTHFRLDLPTPVDVTLTNPPLATANASRATKPVVIDGNLDEWDKANPMDLGSKEQRTLGVVRWNRDHYHATAWASYDDTGLNLAFDVDDSEIISPNPSGGIVDRDCVEVNIDARAPSPSEPLPAVHLGRDVPNIVQYIVAPCAPQDGVPLQTQRDVTVGTGDPGMADGVTAACQLTNRGYVLEMHIPAQHFPGGLKPGTRIGFDWTVNKVDRFPRYLNAVAFRWSGSAWSFISTREYGSLLLQP